LLIRILTNQPTVEKTIVLSTNLLISESLWMIVDKICTLTNAVRVGLDPRSSRSQRRATFR
jgi:hypothetical protein